MSAPPVNNQRTIITHAVLVGLTPLIPIPVIDDLVKEYLQRRMVRLLAASHGHDLSAADLEALASERGGGCLRGCAATILIYPLQKVFRKIFYFLEWKRAVDLTSRTYHHGYLVDYVLGEWWRTTGAVRGASAAEVRDQIDAVCREAPIKPVETAVAATFRGSKNVLVGGARLLERSLRRVTSRAGEPEVARAVEAVEPEEERALFGVVNRLQRAFESVPEEHFRRLRSELAARLERPPAAMAK